MTNPTYLTTLSHPTQPLPMARPRSMRPAGFARLFASRSSPRAFGGGGGSVPGGPAHRTHLQSAPPELPFFPAQANGQLPFTSPGSVFCFWCSRGGSKGNKNPKVPRVSDSGADVLGPQSQNQSHRLYKKKKCLLCSFPLWNVLAQKQLPNLHKVRKGNT